MDEAVADPFKYRHLGSLAYIGNAAVFDFGKFSFMGGLVSTVFVTLLFVDWLNAFSGRNVRMEEHLLE
jgi:NADH dehydrogenase FAD-containing subunit